MSGLEIAGVVLGAFPLLISSIEHWRDVAKVHGLYWQLRKEYSKCRRDIEYHEIIYKRNLKQLLLPILMETGRVDILLANPGGQGWSDQAVQTGIDNRLQESYSLYMGIIGEMNEVTLDIRKELSLDNATIQGKIASQQPDKGVTTPKDSFKLTGMRQKTEYEVFRVKFSLGASVRQGLFDRLKGCNERLEKLLCTSDNVSVLQSASAVTGKEASILEDVFKQARKKANLLFKALHKAWGCPCQDRHIANLRLEHRKIPEINFELLLLSFIPPSLDTTTWFWKELRCGHDLGCKPSPKSVPSPGRLQPGPRTVNIFRSLLPKSKKGKEVVFGGPIVELPLVELNVPVEPNLQLCGRLSGPDEKCIGVIGHEDEVYHLHPLSKRTKLKCDAAPLTLDSILSQDFERQMSRRQRYLIALLLASSVAQLHSTPWLRTELSKEDVLFYPCDDEHSGILYTEPFVRQGFALDPPTTPAADAWNDCSHALGIILLELCFGRRIEDHPLCRNHPARDEQSKRAFTLVAALNWLRGVEDEAGGDYAAAVRWCFVEGPNGSQPWHCGIVKNVVRPLELCQEHFKATYI